MANTIYNIDIFYGFNVDFSGIERECGLDIQTNKKLYQRDISILIPSIGGSQQVAFNIFGVSDIDQLMQCICYNNNPNPTNKRAYFIGAAIVNVSGINTIVGYFRNSTGSALSSVGFNFSAFYTKL